MKPFIIRTEVDRQRYITHIAGLSLAKPWEALVEPHKGKRNLAQNARYWKLLAEIAEQVRVEGRLYSNEVWHEHMKRRFIGLIDLPGGGVIGASTTKENTAEFAEFMTKVESYAASELGVMFEYWER